MGTGFSFHSRPLRDRGTPGRKSSIICGSPKTAELIIAEFHQGGDVAVRNLTSEGHDFLDSVRDPEIWRRTKAGAVKAGGFTVDILKELAKSLIKAAIQQHLTGPGS